MKTKTTFLLVSAGVLAGYLLAPTTPCQDSIPAVVAKQGSAATMMAHPVPVAAPDIGTAPANNDEAASFARWQALPVSLPRFSYLCSSCASKSPFPTRSSS